MTSSINTSRTPDEEDSQYQPSSTATAVGSGSGSDFGFGPLPTNYEDAVTHLGELRQLYEKLKSDHDRDERFASTLQAKVEKVERMATLRNLIPRSLFVREDRYLQELEHVYNWSGISDSEIAEIYRRKLNDNVRQHGASSVKKGMEGDSDSNRYGSFREVPEFYKASLDQQAKQNSSNILKLYNLQKKIAGNNDTS
jgi:hypothetical protein